VREADELVRYPQEVLRTPATVLRGTEPPVGEPGTTAIANRFFRPVSRLLRASPARDVVALESLATPLLQREAAR
jgi:hypothetical protein